MPYLDLRELSVWYGNFRALAEISLGIENGELFTFLGPSGSGKSTILLTVAGFLQPRSGQIVLEGADITDLSPNKRDMGMVFQSYALFPHKSVFDNIAYPLRVRKRSKTELRYRVNELLRMIHLEDCEHRMPHQLSGGQQQRVALSRALSFRPRVLLLDEPLGALDQKLREFMQLEIRRIQRDTKTTVLYVTHDQVEAMTISDRIGVLRDGALEQVGTPREVYERPSNAFVAAFIGGANFLNVKVTSLNKRTCSVEYAGFSIDSVPKPPWLHSAKVVASLMIRPEHLRLREGPCTQPNRLPCTISEGYYVGDVSRYRCILPESVSLEVRQPSHEAPDLYPGANAHLQLDPPRAVLFERSDLLQLRTLKGRSSSYE